MINLSIIYYPVLLILAVNLIATICVLLIMTKYPKYAIHAFNRFMCLRLGLSVKKANINPHTTVSYIERGKRTKGQHTLLCVHGFSSTKYSYMGLIQHLPKKYHVVCLDLPGHGDTNSKEKEEYHILTIVNCIKLFVDHIGLSEQKFHLVGTSLGGHISGVYASVYPDHLYSLSLLCPAGISFKHEDSIIEEAKRTDKYILLPQNNEEFREMIDFITHKKLQIHNIFISGMQQMRNEKNAFYRRFLETMILPENHHLLEENLHKIKTPLLLMWGKEDKVLSVDCLKTMEEKLPVQPRQIHILNEVGHGILLERPRKSAFVINDFISSFVE